MSNSPAPDPEPPRFREKFFRIGCLVNVVLLFIILTIPAVFIPAVARTLGLTSPAADEAAIRGVLDAQVAAWNKGDLDGFMAGYWRDESLTFISADRLTKGWDATRDRYQKKYFTPNAEGKLAERGELAFEELQIESFSPTAAMVRGRYILKLASETATGRFTLAFRKLPGGWKITSDHTSSAEKPAEKK